MYDSIVVSQVLATGMLIGLLFAVAVYAVLGSRRTKDYRKDITNLYVAGRIRQIASKDGINISDEYEAYKQFVKKRKMEDWDLDVTIEEELKERIEDKKKEVIKEGIK